MQFRQARPALWTVSALVLLAGCGGGSSSGGTTAVPQLAPAQQMRSAAFSARGIDSLTGRMGLPTSFHGLLGGSRETSPGWMSEDATGPSAKVYVSDETANAVYIYNAKKPTAPIGTITNGIDAPIGSFIDAKENLYVTNINSNAVTVYAKGKTKPSKTYTTGLSFPVSIVVGGDGTIYVSEFANNAVVEFDAGSMKPSRTVSINEPEGVALDSSNNLYVSYNSATTGTGAVEKFAPKKTTGKDLGITVQFTGDLKLDASNDLILGDQIAETINFYKPGATTAYGSIAVGADPFKLAFNAAEALVYAATAAPAVDIFQAKPSGKETGSITSGLQAATGVSLSPAAPL